MSLIKCQECGSEISTESVACPNCGRPMVDLQPIIQREVLIADASRVDAFPKWLIAPIVIFGALVVFLLIVLMRSSGDDANANLRSTNLNVAITQRNPDTRDTSSRIENPPPSTPFPQAVPPATTTEVRTIPPDKGTVQLEAKVTTKEGGFQSVKDEKFYLLDKDLVSILSDAQLLPIEGQSLENSFGLAILYPEKYGDFQRDSLNAIKSHIKYVATTDYAGKATMKDVKPESYYLFGITKSRTGFAIWNSPVSIIAGENQLNLSPARLNEMSE